MRVTLMTVLQGNPSPDSIILNVKEIDCITQKSILQYLAKHGHIDSLQARVLTAPISKDYYLDILLRTGKELFYEEGTDPQRQKNISLPLVLEVAKKTEEFEIKSFTMVTLNHFRVIQKIGEGTYAEVFLVQTKCDRMLYAMKRINKAECKRKKSTDIITAQFQTLQLGLRQTVRLYFAFEDSHFVYLIVDYCCFGDLYSVMRANKRLPEAEKMTISEKYSIWIQVALAVVSLHARGIIYRDIKPENVLINERGEAKLCDFGFVKKIEDKQKLSELCGSYEYLTPEIMKGEPYDKSLDIYCLGLLFYEMMTGSNPFEGTTPATLQEARTKQVNYEKKGLSLTVKDFLKKLMKEKPEERIGSHNSLDIFTHQFFKENADLVKNIVSMQPLPLKSIKFVMPEGREQRKQVQRNEAYVLPVECYNYLTPKFDVTENVGPRFGVNF